MTRSGCSILTLISANIFLSFLSTELSDSVRHSPLSISSICWMRSSKTCFSASYSSIFLRTTSGYPVPSSSRKHTFFSYSPTHQSHQFTPCDRNTLILSRCSCNDGILFNRTNISALSSLVPPLFVILKEVLGVSGISCTKDLLFFEEYS